MIQRASSSSGILIFFFFFPCCWDCLPLTMEAEKSQWESFPVSALMCTVGEPGSSPGGFGSFLKP